MRCVSRFVFAFLALAAAALFAAPARAEIVARIDKGTQSMTLEVDGQVEAIWPVSTARHGYWTPVGSYSAKGLERMHYSRKYDNAPMPYSVFFKGGYAVHGTYELARLGRPASHGCIRLSTRNAMIFYSLVRMHGRDQTRIIITG